MLQKSITYLSIIVIVIGAIFLANGLILAWTPPCDDPPNCNVPAPLNIGSTGQSKSGGLILNTGGAATGLVIDKGNVGIGTASPGQKLEVNGNLKLSPANPYIYSGSSYIVIPNGLYVSGGTLYVRNTLMARNGIKNDGSADGGAVRIKDSLSVDSNLTVGGTITPASYGSQSLINHDSITGVSASDHHVKTTFSGNVTKYDWFNHNAEVSVGIRAPDNGTAGTGQNVTCAKGQYMCGLHYDHYSYKKSLTIEPVCCSMGP